MMSVWLLPGLVLPVTVCSVSRAEFWMYIVAFLLAASKT
jgi:hypothetical protein